MATQKNQHYVPQFYLRNFSKDGKTIGCCYVNGDKSKHIEAAPIKSQASEDYFYSHHTKLETEFAKLENIAKTIIQKILSDDFKQLNCEEQIFIKEFILFQHIRTPYIANSYEHSLNNFFNQINGTDDGKKRIEIKRKQIFVLSTLMPQIPKAAKRFKLVVLENHSDIPFITSTEPVTFFNPYQKKRKTETGGFYQHGGMLFYPISAKKAILLYDKNAYRNCGKKLLCTISDCANLNAQIWKTSLLTKEHTFYYDNSNTNTIQSLSQMRYYIGDYPILGFIKEKKRYFQLLWI